MRTRRSTSVPPRRATDADRRHVPTWLPIASLALALAGLAVSIYLTYEHFTGNATLACSATGTFDCHAVTTSPESIVFGIPVAVLGLVFFVGIIPFLLPAAWGSPSRLIRDARIGGCVVGVGFVFYLIYVELFEIDKVCPWCTGVHAITLALFGVVAFGTAATAED